MVGINNNKSFNQEEIKGQIDNLVQKFENNPKALLLGKVAKVAVSIIFAVITAPLTAVGFVAGYTMGFLHTDKINEGKMYWKKGYDQGDGLTKIGITTAKILLCSAITGAWVGQHARQATDYLMDKGFLGFNGRL